MSIHMCVQWVKALGESQGENLRMSSGCATNRESTPPRAAVRTKNRPVQGNTL